MTAERRRDASSAVPLAAAALAIVALGGGCGRTPSDETAPARTEAARPAAPTTRSPSGSSATAEATDAASSATPWFREDAAARGLVFTHESGAEGAWHLPEIMGGGVALLDHDDDGDLDVYLVQGNRLGAPPDPARTNRFFVNDGTGRFVDATDATGTGDAGCGFGAATGDYDGDGDVDLYVCNLGRNVLYRNDGGRFVDATEASGTACPGFSTCAAFVDYDGDGDLDLLVSNYLDWTPASERPCFTERGERDYCNPSVYRAPVPDTLFRNEGDGTFTDVSAASGLGGKPGTGLGVVCGDFTGDGRVDLFVANDGMYDHLWVNLGDGRFEEKAPILGCACDDSGKPKAGMGVCAIDLDDDGDEDLLVGNLVRETDSLYRNDGGVFVDVTAASGLAAISRSFTRWGMGFVDLDHDGVLDLHLACGRVRRQSDRFSDDDVFAEPNLLLRGLGGLRLEELAPRGGTAPEIVRSSRASAYGDLDGDGDLDAVVVNRDAPASLLVNDAPKAGRSLRLRVRERSGADAIGARVRIELDDGRTVTRTVRTAWSYAAANDPRVHVGLGPTARARSIEVTWADGATDVFPPPDGDGEVRRK